MVIASPAVWPAPACTPLAANANPGPTACNSAAAATAPVIATLYAPAAGTRITGGCSETIGSSVTLLPGSNFFAAGRRCTEPFGRTIVAPGMLFCSTPSLPTPTVLPSGVDNSSAILAPAAFFVFKLKLVLPVAPAFAGRARRSTLSAFAKGKP